MWSFSKILLSILIIISVIPVSSLSLSVNSSSSQPQQSTEINGHNVTQNNYYVLGFLFVGFVAFIGFFLFVILKSILGITPNQKKESIADELSDTFNCIKCGSKVEKGLNFCYQCGYRFY